MENARLIYESNQTQVFLSTEGPEGKPVVIKTFVNEDSWNEASNQLENEREISRLLPGGLFRRLLETTVFMNRRACVFEYVEGQDLKQSIPPRGMELAPFFHLAIECARKLDELHGLGIIHRDINPANLLHDPQTGKVSLIDFGIATRLSTRNADLAPPNQLAGTLKYIAPEQTGRMNRVVDYRSDLYSLGATYFHMLSGRLPFQAEDPMELVHAHIAVPAPSLESLAPQVPAVLSRLVAKLMAKNAEDRYQSARGLLHDLELLGERHQKGFALDIELGREDVSDRFSVPEKLYGREGLVEKLVSRFELACKGESQFVAISGLPGVGKSSLVNELHKPIAAHRGFFLSGKFDPHRRNLPYLAWAQAFDKLIDALLALDAEPLDEWRSRVRGAVGKLGKVLLEVCPNLELLLGPQPEPPPLASEQARQRFLYLFKEFIEATTPADSPVVFFLDDWQWADAASIGLLVELAKEQRFSHALVVFSYRDDELGPEHPFALALAAIEDETGRAPEALVLANLSPDDLGQMVRDTLRLPQDNDKSRRLVSKIFQKTQGNPFFAHQFLHRLHEDGLVRFDAKARQWDWDEARLEQMNITDNVVQLMSQKVDKLPQDSRETLRWAACLGSSFRLGALATLRGQGNLQTLDQLETSLAEGLVLPGSSPVVPRDGMAFKFVHDRVHQAVYESLDDDRRALIHWQVALAQGQMRPGETLAPDPAKVFELANHLRNAAGHALAPEHAGSVRAVFALAADKAFENLAYQTSYDYAQLAYKSLGQAPWAQHHQAALRLAERLALAAQMTQQYELMEGHIGEILENAKGPLETINAQEVAIASLATRGRLDEAVRLGIRVLASLGRKLPVVPNMVEVKVAVVRALLALGSKKPESMVELPTMEAPLELAQLKIMLATSFPAFFSQPNLAPILACAQIRLCLKHGVTADASYALSTFAFIKANSLGDKPGGRAFAETALALTQKFQDTRHLPRAQFIRLTTIEHWLRPWPEVVPALEQNYPTSLQNGDLEMAAYSVFQPLAIQLYHGDNLRELRKKMDRLLPAVRKTAQQRPINVFNKFRQFVDCLVGKAQVPTLLVGEFYDEKEKLPIYEKEQDISSLAGYHLLKMVLCFHFGKLREAVLHSLELEKVGGALAGLPDLAWLKLYQGLVHHQARVEKVFPKKANHAKLLRRNAKELAGWAKRNPQFEPYARVLEAMLLNADGQREKALVRLDRAAHLARRGKMLNLVGLANQLAGELFVGDPSQLTGKYLQGAYNGYASWGAEAVAQSLFETYPEYVSKSRGGPAINTHSTVGTTTQANLDAETLVKASQTLSGEIQLASLLQKLMLVIVQNAGAQSGALVEHRDGRLVVQAERDAAGVQLILHGKPLAQASNLPKTLVNFVARSQKVLVFDNLATEQQYMADPYVASRQPKSALCFPIVKQSRLMGILYLENNLAAGAFTPQRLELLKVLSSQIIISLENALLYESLEEKVRIRTAELQEANAAIQLQKEAIEESHRQITDSITYASRIQNALMPPDATLSQAGLPGFVLWLPRDVVSGDFFWIKDSPDQLLAVAADCTGHGVPGAFMSMLGVSFLNELSSRHPILENPGALLGQMRDKVKGALHQTQKARQPQDGMDLALLAIDKRTLELRYSGANNPLILIRKAGMPPEVETENPKALATDSLQADGMALHEIKADKMPIGIYIREKPFSNTRVQLLPGDRLYTFSDGFKDQWGGPNGETFKSKRFKELLLRMAPMPPQQQKNILHQALIDWMGTRYTQVDDVLVLCVTVPDLPAGG